MARPAGKSPKPRKPQSTKRPAKAGKAVKQAAKPAKPKRGDPAPILSTTTVGPLTLKLRVPSAGDYGQPIVLVVSLRDRPAAAFRFTPGDGRRTVSNHWVGDTALSFTASYAPADPIGCIDIIDGTAKAAGRPPQPFQGMAFSWDTGGNILHPLTPKRLPPKKARAAEAA